jgi:hypothetical protein
MLLALAIQVRLRLVPIDLAFLTPAYCCGTNNSALVRSPIAIFRSRTYRR